MKTPRFFASASLSAALACALPAQPVNEGCTLSIDSGSRAWALSWWGAVGRTYFIQNSDLNLANWVYWPVIEQGVGTPVAYGFWPNPPPERLFLRLRHTDQPTTDAYGADFDGDSIPNGWELEQGLDPFDPSDAALLKDGLTHLAIFLRFRDGGADPSTANVAGLLVFTP